MVEDSQTMTGLPFAGSSEWDNRVVVRINLDLWSILKRLTVNLRRRRNIKGPCPTAFFNKKNQGSRHLAMKTTASANWLADNSLSPRWWNLFSSLRQRSQRIRSLRSVASLTCRCLLWLRKHHLQIKLTAALINSSMIELLLVWSTRA